MQTTTIYSGGLRRYNKLDVLAKLFSTMLQTYSIRPSETNIELTWRKTVYLKQAFNIMRAYHFALENSSCEAVETLISAILIQVLLLNNRVETTSS